MKRSGTAGIAATIVVAVLATAAAAAYPDKPVQYIVLQALEPDTSWKTEDVTPVYFVHYTPDAIIVAADSLEMMPPFMKERTQEYLNSAKALGLVK